jgi:hypothetical protein
MASHDDDDLPPELEDMSGVINALQATKLKDTKDEFSSPDGGILKGTSSSSSTNSNPITKRYDTSLAMDGGPLSTTSIPGKSLADAAMQSSCYPTNNSYTNSSSSSSSTSTTGASTEKNDDENTLQAQLLEAATAAKKVADKEKAAAEKAMNKEFMKGTAVKKGFLLGGSSSPKSSSSPASKLSTTTGSPSSTIITKPSPKNNSNDTNIPFIKANPQAVNNPFLLPEVQQNILEQVPAMERTLTNQQKEWLTPEFLQKVAKDPYLIAGMQNPKYMEAINALSKDPKAATKYRNDPGIQDFITRFMGVMGEHFQKLGETQEIQQQMDASSSSASTATTKNNNSSSNSNNSNKSTGTTHSTDNTNNNKNSLDLVPTMTRSLTTATTSSLSTPSTTTTDNNTGNPWPTKGILAPDSNVSTDEITTAAREKRLPNADDEVTAALSDKDLVNVLRDPVMQRIMEECRLDGRKLPKYLRDPDIRRKFMVLQKHGLIRIE